MRLPGEGGGGGGAFEVSGGPKRSRVWAMSSRQRNVITELSTMNVAALSIPVSYNCITKHTTWSLYRQGAFHSDANGRGWIRD